MYNWLYNFRPAKWGEIEIYPDRLQVSEPFIKVQVGEITTIEDLIREARERFDLQNIDSDFRCSEILLDSGGMCFKFLSYPLAI